MTDLTEDERARGVVAVSSGNHAQGVAWAAQRLGIAATIVMPSDAPHVKLSETRRLGAEVVLYERLTQSRDAIAAEICAARGCVLVHAYGDPWVIEGQGSTGIELASQMACFAGGPPTRVVTPCGGGGLASGLALACPEAEIVPVEPEGWDDVTRSLAGGAIVGVGANPPATSCDAFADHGDLSDQLCGHDVARHAGRDGERAAVRTAQAYAFARLHLVIEPGGAAGLRSSALWTGAERRTDGGDPFRRECRSGRVCKSDQLQLTIELSLFTLMSATNGAAMTGMDILKPVVALAIWTMVMWVWMYATRIPAITALPKTDDPNADVGWTGAKLEGLIKPRYPVESA